MRAFAKLYSEIDESTRTTEKVAALERYFAAVPAEDSVWALFFLTGNKLPRPVSSKILRGWLSEESKLPPWLVDECYDAVGDLAETLAMLLPEPATPSERPLHEVVEQYLRPLRGAAPTVQRELLRSAWAEFDIPQRFLFHKLLLGGFRVGVSQTLVVRALAQHAGVPKEELAHRLMGAWEPTVQEFARLIQPGPAARDITRPYPFCLAHPLEDAPETLGPVEDWQLEWKWDGIRAQLIHREGEVLVWSRGEELVTDRFPEIQAVGRALPPGTVLDGEILCWREGRPLPFQLLQQRIGRKTVGKKLLVDAPVAFMAYDLLEVGDADWRERPLAVRRAGMERVVEATRGVALMASPLVIASDWEEAAAQRAASRERGVEGLMIKRQGTAYGVGRVRGEWWKWKVNPHTMDAVLIYAQRGHGRRASLYTDYTFAVWDGDALVPVAKAYSGLTDAEIKEVDEWIRHHVIEQFGPVRSVTPELVFEIAFEGIGASPRHRSGIAVRFPRITRWRKDKRPADADRIETLRAMSTA